MGSDKQEASGIVGATSRRAGSLVGTSVVMGKKITRFGSNRMTSLKGMLGRLTGKASPLIVRQISLRTKKQKPIAEKQSEEAEAKKDAARALVVALESNLASARDELANARKQAEQSQSELLSQLKALHTEKESLICDLDKVHNQVKKIEKHEDQVESEAAMLQQDLMSAKRQIKKAYRAKAAEFDQTPKVDIKPVSHLEEEMEMEMEMEQQELESIVEGYEAAEQEQVSEEQEQAEVQIPVPSYGPSVAEVALDEVDSAVFARGTDKIIFVRALSELVSQDASVRADAVRTIAGVRHELSIGTVIAHIATESSAQVRQECIKALTSLGMKESLGTIEQALTDPAPGVRLAAVWGVYRLGQVGSAPILLRMLSDKDKEVRRRAVTCIGWLGQKELVMELLPLLTDSSNTVRRAAAKVMGNLGSRQVVSTLIESLKEDPDRVTRKVILSAIEKITGKKMGSRLPSDEKALERLAARWRGWWKEELLS